MEEQLDPRAGDAGAGADGDLAGMRVNGPDNSGADSRSKAGDYAAKLAAIFPTYSLSFAWFDPETLRKDAKGKSVPDNPTTVRRAVTVADWEAHVAGKRAIGVVPAADDGCRTTSWGAGDVDDYGIDVAELAGKVERLKLPVTVYLTKSNGARYVISTTEPVPASLMRAAVEAVGRRFGLDPGKLEIFPKQNSPEKLGTVLWMPYCGKRFPGVKRTGAKMTPGEFVATVEERRLTPDQLAALAAPAPNRVAAATSAEDGATYAAAMLDRYAEELAETTTNRNETLNKFAFHLATMIAHGWIERDLVEERLLEACEANGLIADEPQKTRDTMARAIEEGMRHPHEDVHASARGRPSHAQILAELADAAELFHSPDATGFADIEIDGHRETWLTRSKGFKLWLTRQFYQETASAPSPNAVRSALDVIEARARFDGPERAVNLRVGGLDGRIYIDLCDPEWRAVEVDAAGWRIVSNPPVRFRRTAGMRPLPVPEPGGSIGALRPFLNLSSDDEFVMLVSWLLAALRDRGPYPLLVVGGEQGSAKTFLGRLVRSLVDPSTLQDRALPREDRDLFIAANNSYVLAFDNLSGMPPWISDTLCRLATGGGFATRELYTDSDEMLFDAKRPVILNGIEDVATRGDLADRSIVLTLTAIPEDERRTEAELLAEFDGAHPKILGALLDVVSHGLRMLPETRLARLPRMADFALWGAACETKLWPKGTFERAYAENRAGMVEKVLGDDPFGVAVRDLIDSQKPGAWTGTATELLRVLNIRTEPRMRDKWWPGAPNKVAGRMRRVQPFLRQLGIVVESNKNTANVTQITIRRGDLLDRNGDAGGLPI